jgi:hypothetical protein
MGRSNYTGNADSYTQASDPDAASSVDKGALSRLLAKKASDEADAVRNLQISTGPNYGDDIRNSKSDTSPYEDEPHDPMEVANMRANLSPAGPRVMPTRPSQDVSGPVARPMNAVQAVTRPRRPDQQRAEAAAADQAIIDRISQRMNPNPKLNSLRATRNTMMGMKDGGSAKNYTDKGGKINLGSGRVSTASKGKKNAGW